MTPREFAHWQNKQTDNVSNKIVPSAQNWLLLLTFDGACYHGWQVQPDAPSIQDITIRVCDSLTCELFGSEKLIKDLSDGLDKKKVRVLRAPCMGLCDKAPACEVGHKHVNFSSLEKIKKYGEKINQETRNKS